ncbi:PREDICTED: uncharacterized protein LOC104803158 [Tarenaya hassleriana]|uniref:uncharacterized protein LOC104803158 n=1 Tax=Tarenaya hassleriana TaxID=28532 RepID=UPI00053C9DE9|nr:PREDICTED: uncharacterized protein LOC104803158 [Tarenaya hassleriana]
MVEVEYVKVKSVIYKVGMMEKVMVMMEMAVDDYAIDEKCNLYYKKSTSDRIEAKCGMEGCKWRIYASLDKDSGRFIVKTFKNVHTCSWNCKIRLLTARKIAHLILDDLRADSDLNARKIKKMLLSKYSVVITKTKCQKAREIGLKIIEEEHAEQFARMYDYVLELRQSNPGSTVILGTQNDVFQKFYICFNALKDGWKMSCRPILHLDGTFLRGWMKDELLTAVGRDANDQMYHVAWAIVDVENKINWEWFLTLLVDDLNLGVGQGFTMVSDQQKGLIQAMKNILPYAEHRICAKHIYENWKKKHKGSENRISFWKTAKAYNQVVFDKCLEDLKILSPTVHEDLMRYSIFHWSRCSFTEFAKCDAVENNMGEAFNSTITDAREKPIVEMLETIRRQVITKFDATD